MDVRTKVLHAAAELLSRAPEADIQTRDVAAAAGVGAPALYRQFGDKEGLLSAVVDFGFEQYLASKRALVPGADPVDDLRQGWTNHTAFALANPNYYRLMCSPGLKVPPRAVGEAHELLLTACRRVAAADRLRTTPEAAADVIMAANVGAALSCLARPDQYPDTSASDRLRDLVVDGLTRPTSSAATVPAPAPDLARAAITLSAQLDAAPSPALHPAEAALLRHWLDRLSDPTP